MITITLYSLNKDNLSSDGYTFIQLRLALFILDSLEGLLVFRSLSDIKSAHYALSLIGCYVSWYIYKQEWLTQEIEASQTEIFYKTGPRVGYLHFCLFQLLCKFGFWKFNSRLNWVYQDKL